MQRVLQRLSSKPLSKQRIDTHWIFTVYSNLSITIELGTFCHLFGSCTLHWPLYFVGQFFLLSRSNDMNKTIQVFHDACVQWPDILQKNQCRVAGVRLAVDYLLQVELTINRVKHILVCKSWVALSPWQVLYRRGLRTVQRMAPKRRQVNASVPRSKWWKLEKPSTRQNFDDVLRLHRV